MMYYWLMWGDAPENPQAFLPGMVSTWTTDSQRSPWKSGSRAQLGAALASSEAEYVIWRLAHPINTSRPATRIRATDGRLYVVNAVGALVLK